MSLPTDTFTTYLAKGMREDLSNEIYRIDPVDTPFMSAIEKVKATAVNHEWQTQALASVDTSNAAFEGSDAVTDAVTATVRLGNICQISDKVARVTRTEEVVLKAGRDSELEYQEMLKGMELKRDMEAILSGTNQAKNTGAAATARLTASVLSWIKTNTNRDEVGAGADPTTADGVGTRTDGTQRQFTEAQLKNVFSEIWTSGGKPNLVLAGAFNKQMFSTFTGRATVTEDAKSKAIIATVDAYESDFGRVSVKASRFMRARDVLVLETDKWQLASLRKFESTPLAITGDNRRKHILSEYALVACNEKSSGGVFDLTTS
jgi:hypothetical protein